jgi:hypothetical protein
MPLHIVLSISDRNPDTRRFGVMTIGTEERTLTRKGQQKSGDVKESLDTKHDNEQQQGTDKLKVNKTKIK